jgi:hypothetical protein
LACILGLDGFYMDGRNIRASYGTSKYCSAFIKNVRCNNPECTYLHQMGDVEDTFTKQEIQAGYVTSGRDVLARQQQIVAQALIAASGAAGIAPRRRIGGGGPSSTGKSCTTPVFPAPTYDEPAKLPMALVPPPLPAAAVVGARAVTTSSGFPTIAAANASQAAPDKIVRSSSTGVVSSTPAGGFSGPTPKGSIGQAPTRKNVIGGPGIGDSNGSGPMIMPPPGATAASVVAGVHSISGSSAPPAPHTTLTPLTALKRSNVAKGGAKVAPIGASSGDDMNSAVQKGLTPAERSATKLTSLRGGAGKKQNGPRSGSAPGSPSSEASNKHASSTHADGHISLIGGAVIGAPGAKVPTGGGSAGSINSGLVSATTGPGSLSDLGNDGLGGLGGELFTGSLKATSNTSFIGSGTAFKDRWNSAPIGGDLWTNGNTSGSTSVGLGAALGSNQGGGGFIAGTGTIGGGGTGSSALASMLGIHLPTGSGSLRESTNLWSAPAPADQPLMSALNSSSMPMQGVIGPTSMYPNNGLIGGLTIGGGPHTPMGAGSIGSGGNKSDVALLQSFLPGVHITSGSSHQQGSGFGTIGGGGWGTPGPNQTQQRVNNPGLRLGEPHHWGGGIQPSVGGAPVGAIGQSGGPQNQRQAPGSIW